MTKNKKNLLVLATTFPTFIKNDSTPPFVYELTKRLTNECSAYVLTPYIEDSKTIENKDKVKIIRFKYGFTALCNGAIIPNIKKNKWLIFQVPFLMFFYWLNLCTTIKKYNIEIIHAHWILPLGWMAVFYKIFFNKKIKVVTTGHGADVFDLRFLNFLKKWVIKNSDRTTVVSSALKKYLIKIDSKIEDKIDIISMGVDDARFNYKKYSSDLRKKLNTKHMILFVGRLAEKKGVKYLIKSIPAVVKEFSDLKCVIIGHGPQEDELKEMAKDYSDNIIFLGGINNNYLPQYFASADLFVGPSIKTQSGDQEGFGLVFVESLLSKTAVISSKLDAISAIVIDGKTGLKVNVKNSKKLSSSIIKLLKNNKYRRKLEESGYRFVKERYTWDIVSKKYSEVLCA